MQRGQLSPESSKKIEIVKLLTHYSLRRSVAVNPEGLAVYAADLMPFEEQDIREALTRLGQEEPADFKPALHPIGTILAEVRATGRERRIAADKFDREQEVKNREQHRSAFPDDYTPARDVWAEAVEKLKAKSMDHNTQLGASRTEAK